MHWVQDNRQPKTAPPCYSTKVCIYSSGINNNLDDILKILTSTQNIVDNILLTHASLSMWITRVGVWSTVAKVTHVCSHMWSAAKFNQGGWNQPAFIL